MFLAQKTSTLDLLFGSLNQEFAANLTRCQNSTSASCQDFVFLHKNTLTTQKSGTIQSSNSYLPFNKSQDFKCLEEILSLHGSLMQHNLPTPISSLVKGKIFNAKFLSRNALPYMENWHYTIFQTLCAFDNLCPKFHYTRNLKRI